MSAITPQIIGNNHTRRTPSFPKKFLREGRFHLLPIFWLLRLSDLAREGMDHSGSFEFADHVYRNQPSGRGWIGRDLDRRLLAMRATQAMRRRYERSRDEMRRALSDAGERPCRILSVPCGIPRDLIELCENPHGIHRLHYVGMDLDPHVLDRARQATTGCRAGSIRFHSGNALCPQYPPDKFDLIVSTGLGEFLNDDELALFYANAFNALADGGRFFTSATNLDKTSERFLSAFELRTHYRSARHVRKILELQAWKKIRIDHDASGLQAFTVAKK